MRKSITCLALVIAVAGCSSGGGGSSPSSAPQPQQGPLALQSQSTGSGETQVTLQARADAGTIVTLVGQLDYDVSRLSVKGCTLGSGPSNAGKSLSFAEPVPGVVRTIVQGGLQPLPEGSDILSCTFAAVAGAPTGDATVHAHGTVADTTLADRSFSSDSTVKVGN